MITLYVNIYSLHKILLSGAAERAQWLRGLLLFQGTCLRVSVAAQTP